MEVTTTSDRMQTLALKMARIIEAMGAVARRGVPGWIDANKDDFSGKINALPTREDITLPIREQLIIELYSK